MDRDRTPGWTASQRQALEARRCGRGDVRRLVVDDGPARGQRLIVLRNATGVEVEISVDRGFDLYGLRYRGVDIGWGGPIDPHVPISPEEDAGLGLLRGFGGFLVTCGLDHYGVPVAGPADHFIYPNRSSVRYPLHGRLSSIPAHVEGSGADYDAAVPYLWARGLVRQAVVFGEVLELHREIRLELLSPVVTITDRVVNAGSRPARHGMLYHFNIGYPLLDAATCLEGVEDSFTRNFGDEPAVPSPDIVESFDGVRLLASPDGQPIVKMRNPAFDDLCVSLSFDPASLPQFGVWRAYQSGLFALGLEPHTGLGDASMSYVEGSPDFLSAGSERMYRLQVEISSNRDSLVFI